MRCEEKKGFGNMVYVQRGMKAKTIGKMTHKAKSATASLCEVTGHDWEKMTSDKVQVCKRCRIVKQLIKGHWRYVHKVTSKNVNLHKEAVELASLWEEVLE